MLGAVALGPPSKWAMYRAEPAAAGGGMFVPVAAAGAGSKRKTSMLSRACFPRISL
jgi:hypothetical protein